MRRTRRDWQFGPQRRRRRNGGLMDGKRDRWGEDSTEAIKIGDENGHFFVPSALGSPNRNKKRQRPKKIGLTHPLWASSKEAGLVF